MAIVISSDLIGVYQDSIDALINQLGKNLILEFDAVATTCPNCEFDPISKRSRGVYRARGPVPFSGTRCPYCMGIGSASQPVRRCVRGLVKWTSADSENFAIGGVRDGKGLLRLKTLLSDACDIARCNFAIYESGGLRFKLKLSRKPTPEGLQTSRYAVSTWEVVQ